MTNENAAQENRHRLSGPEALRGLAALLILVTHGGGFAGLPLPPGVDFSTDHGALGVNLFFCLSGFVLSFGFNDRLATREQTIDFWVRRFFRIAPLFYVMLLVWAPLHPALPDGEVASGPQDLLLNVTLLFGLAPGLQHSMVPTAWTIGVEVLFYAAFPLIVLFVRSVRAALIAYVATLALSTVVFDSFVPAIPFSPSLPNTSLLIWLPHFAAGILFYWIWRRVSFGRHAWGWLVLGGAVFACAIALTPPAQDLFIQVRLAERIVWSLAFGALILGSVLVKTALERRPLVYLGKISYSVYMVHPFVFFLFSLTLFPLILTAHLGPYLTYAVSISLSLLIVIPLASLTYRFVEEPGMRLGKVVSRLWLQHEPPTSAQPQVPELAIEPQAAAASPSS
jgi:peptidoglycan/LPS O-acetylase OafA/YrhL